MTIPIPVMHQKLPIHDPSAWAEAPSGLIVPALYRPKPKPKAFDCFCGIGGFSLGFLQAGYEVVAGCDNDPNATITYLYNLGAYPVNIVYLGQDEAQRAVEKERLNTAVEAEIRRSTPKGGVPRMLASGSNRPAAYPGVSTYFFGDIHYLTGRLFYEQTGLKPGELDVMMGGPPCQGFSMAGKRDVMDPRNSLIFEFGRVVGEIKPKTFVMENVPGIASMVTPEGVPVIDMLCHILETDGYGTYDALRKSLLGKEGARAVLRGTGTRKQSKASDAEREALTAEEDDEYEQLSLLER